MSVLSPKIRNAQLEKVPYTLVVGDNDVEKKGVSPRARGEGKAAELPFMTLEEFTAHIVKDATVPF